MRKCRAMHYFYKQDGRVEKGALSCLADHLLIKWAPVTIALAGQHGER